MKKTKDLALGGILTALSLVILAVGSLIGIGTFAGPVLAAGCLLPFADKGKRKEALLVYFSSALLGLFLLSDRELALVYLFMGWYPVAVYSLRKLPKALRLLVQLCIYGALLILLYGVVMKVLGIPIEIYGGPVEMAALALLGAVLFLLLDPAYANMARLWKRAMDKIRF